MKRDAENKAYTMVTIIRMHGSSLLIRALSQWIKVKEMVGLV